jgi:hypothetical protein
LFDLRFGIDDLGEAMNSTCVARLFQRIKSTGQFLLGFLQAMVVLAVFVFVMGMLFGGCHNVQDSVEKKVLWFLN